MEKYQKVEKVGEGTYGTGAQTKLLISVPSSLITVYKALIRGTNRYVALKKMKVGPACFRRKLTLRRAARPGGRGCAEHSHP
jgi:hypothetical protein